MKLNPTVKVAACLATLFLFGGVCGFAMSGWIVGRWTTRTNAAWTERWLERRVAEDFATLQPSSAQQAQLRPLYHQLVADFVAIQQDSAQRVNDAFRRFNREVRGKLTSEQREAMRELMQKRRGRAPGAIEEAAP
jgi:hypothetical protein